MKRINVNTLITFIFFFVFSYLCFAYLTESRAVSPEILITSKSIFSKNGAKAIAASCGFSTAGHKQEDYSPCSTIVSCPGGNQLSVSGTSLCGGACSLGSYTCPTPTCSNGASNYPQCNNNVCTNGATNYPACNTFPSCTNGATNAPACNTCPTGYSLTNGSCVQSICTNGATNYPACNTFPSCTNGATNAPACNTCPTGYSLTNGSCAPVIPTCPSGLTVWSGTTCPIVQTGICHNSSNNYPACDNVCENGMINPPICNVPPTCENGANNYPVCDTFSTPLVPICNNGATNYPACNTFPSCTNGASNYPQCNNNVCTNGATNYPACNTFPSCTNGATNAPACNTCPTGYSLTNGSCVQSICTNGATNYPVCDDNKNICVPCSIQNICGQVFTGEYCGDVCSAGRNISDINSSCITEFKSSSNYVNPNGSVDFTWKIATVPGVGSKCGFVDLTTPTPKQIPGLQNLDSSVDSARITNIQNTSRFCLVCQFYSLLNNSELGNTAVHQWVRVIRIGEN